MFTLDPRGWGRQVPPSPAYPLDPAHPRARGLQLCLLPHPGVQWYDRSGAGRHGALVGAPAWTARGLRFPGSTATRAEIGGLADFNFLHETGRFTLSVRGQLEAISDAAYTLVSSSGSSAEIGFAFFLENRSVASANKQLRLLVSRGVLGSYIIDARSDTLAVNDTADHQLAVVGDGSSVTFYVDGRQWGASVAYAQPFLTAGTNATRAMMVGALNGSTLALPWLGAISGVQVYNRALPASEIREDFERPNDIISAPAGNVWAVASVGGGGVQSITGAGFTDADAFGSGTLAPGAVSITGSGFTDTDTFGVGALAAGAVEIAGAGFADADTFGAGSVMPGPVEIAGAGFVDLDTFGAGAFTVAPAHEITGAGFADADTFGGGALVPGPVGISGAGFVDADAFGVGILLPGVVEIVGSGFVDLDSFGSGAFMTDGAQIVGTGFVDADSFGGGVLVPGAVAILGSGFADLDAFGGGRLVSLEEGEIIGHGFTDIDTFGAGALVRRALPQLRGGRATIFPRGGRLEN